MGGSDLTPIGPPYVANPHETWADARERATWKEAAMYLAGYCASVERNHSGSSATDIINVLNSIIESFNEFGALR